MRPRRRATDNTDGMMRCINDSCSQFIVFGEHHETPQVVVGLNIVDCLSESGSLHDVVEMINIASGQVPRICVCENRGPLAHLAPFREQLGNRALGHVGVHQWGAFCVCHAGTVTKVGARARGQGVHPKSHPVGKTVAMRITLPSGTSAEIVHVDDPVMGLVIAPDIFGLRPLYDDMVAKFAARVEHVGGGGGTVPRTKPRPRD